MTLPSHSGIPLPMEGRAATPCATQEPAVVGGARRRPSRLAAGDDVARQEPRPIGLTDRGQVRQEPAIAQVRRTSGRSHYVFGPVPSRRLGRSLGVDLVPFKTCSYDCIYCQLGRTTCQTIERKEWVPMAAVLETS